MLRCGMVRVFGDALISRTTLRPMISLAEHCSSVHFQPAASIHCTSTALVDVNLQSESVRQHHNADHVKSLQNDPALRRKVLVNRLLYRSRQRGFLEMDLLVGIWAEQQVPILSDEMLIQFSEVLDQENPDLYKWLTGQEKPSAAMVNNTAYQVCTQHLVPSQPDSLLVASVGSCFRLRCSKAPTTCRRLQRTWLCNCKTPLLHQPELLRGRSGYADGMIGVRLLRCL